MAPTAASLSLCDACFWLTSSTENIMQMATPNGLRFHRSLDYLDENSRACKMCAWVFEVSDPRHWSFSGESLDIGLRSYKGDGDSRSDYFTFDSVAIDTFGLGAPGTAETRGWVSMPMVADADDPASKYILKRPPISDHRSQESTVLIARWMRHCEASHSLCQPPIEELPTHAIDVSGDGDVRLVDSKGQKSKYACLTYCWGVAKQPAMLQRENKDSMMQNIPLKELPPTIQDAIHVTRSLNLQYLWIDALCIMQDDSQDAGEELRAMAKIYGNASITISASCSQSVSEGFLQERPLSQKDSHDYVVLPYRCPDGTLGQIRSVMSFKYNISEEPITKRAWTMQEQLLSPRLVIYGKKTVLWECQTGQWPIEDLDVHQATDSSTVTNVTIRLNNEFFDPALKEQLPNEPFISSARSSWQSLVESYSRRSLTYGSDKLNAISALKNVYSLAFPNHEYIAGLFYNPKLPGSDLLHQLLWHVPYLDLNERYTDPRIAPSWSWASINGPVKWRPDYKWQPVSTRRLSAMRLSEKVADIYWAVHNPWFLEENANRALASVDKWTPTDITIQYPYTGMTVLGELTMTAFVKKALLHITNDDHISHRNAMVTAVPDGGRVPREELNVYIDTKVFHLTGQIFPCELVRIVEGHGLVVMEAGKTATGEIAYERVGMFREECHVPGPPWVAPVEYWFVGAKERKIVLV